MFSAVHRRAPLAKGRLVGAACAASLLALAGPSCTRDLGLLALPDAGTVAEHPAMDLNPPADTAGAAGASGGAGGAGGSPLCGTARVRFPDASGTCAGTLASRSHRFALCSCSDWSPAAPVNTDATSSNPNIMAGPVAAAVGVNGKLAASASLSIRGSVYASGVGGISTNTTMDVFKTLRTAGPVVLTPPAVATVYTDAYVGGDVMGPLHVLGTLHMPASAMLGLAATAMATTREAVSVPDPCDCTTPFDVGSVITATASVNDNAANQWDPNRLVNPVGVANVDIPCGTFFLTSITSLSPVNLRVHGRALLAVAGNVNLSNGMTIQFDPGAELDLLIGGGLTSYGPYPVGAYQAAYLRVWMAGSAPIALYGDPTAGGIFHAPLADVTAPNGMVFWGSMVAASFNFGGPVQWHFDQTVLSSGMVCGDPQQDPVP